MQDSILSLIERDEQLRASTRIASSPDPETAAKANRVARKTGLPAPVVERNLAEVEMRERVRNWQQAVLFNPSVGPWLANPRNAAVVADDDALLKQLSDHHKSLWGKSAQPRVDMVANARGPLARVGALLERGLSGVNAGLDRVEASVARSLGFDSWADRITRSARRNELVTSTSLPNEVQWKDVKRSPTVGNVLTFGVEQGVQSLPGMVTAVAGLPLYVISQAGNIGQDRAENNKAEDANLRDIALATPAAIGSALLERVGGLGVLGGAGSNAAIRIGGAAAGEALTEAGQSALEYAGGSVGTEKGFKTGEALDQMLAGSVAGGIAGGGLRGTIEVGERAARVAGDKITSVVEARRGAKALDDLAEIADASKLRQRDPEAFAGLLRALGGEQADNVYVPAEVVREYLQSDADYDREFWGDYSDQIGDALATGGDIVIPADQAIANLTGTPAWDALKEDMRLSPGGISMREAAEVEGSFEGDIDKLAADAVDRVRRDLAANDGRQQLFDSVYAKLTNAGYTPDAARLQAELIASRYTTRAARLGREVTGREFDAIEINRVLPEHLGPIVAADGLDMVVNAMRLARSGKAKRGPSLLEWIAARGGISDTGGDIASMGGDRWHLLEQPKKVTVKKGRSKGKERLVTTVPGRRKLIRESLRGQGDILGGTGGDRFGLDDTLQAAIEAGYFPELARVETNDATGTYANKVDAQAILDAISEELRGNARYAEEVVPDATRAAADELAQMLDQAGLDPASATDADIRAAVDSYRQQAQGRSYDQAAIDGLPLVEFGDFVTGKPVTFDFVHNTQSATKLFGKPKKGDRFQRDLEPSGRYVNEYTGDGDNLPDGLITGTLTFQSPLVLNGENWKAELSAKFGKTGKALSKAILAAGFDGVVTVQLDGRPGRSHTSEIVDLTTFDEARALYQPAFHGSPHIFDKFSLDYMGSGEGAQAFGWGLYFTGRKEIAEFYREELSGRSVESRNYRVGGRQADLGSLFEKARAAAQSAGARGDAARAIAAEIRDSLEEMGGRPAREFLEEYSVDPAYQDAYAAAAEAYGDLRYEMNDGRLYEVDIPEDNEYLLWDKPLSEQPEKVREALEKSGFAIEDPAPRPVIEKQGSVYRIVHSDGVWTGTYRTKELAQEELDQRYPENEWAWTGEKFYRQAAGEGASRGLTNSEGAKAASLALKDAGIAGIKYLDGASRASGDGDYNYVVFDDSRVSIRSYEQSYMDNARGRVTFGANTTVIDLFEKRDLSTFLHETGHVWLEELRADAMLTDAPEQLRADWQTVQDWFAANGHAIAEDGTIPVEAHEMWARGVERFAMEGKAPSSALRRAFEAFRSWLLTIYQVVDNLRSPISPEVRDVMARMVATDEEIALAAEEQKVSALFTDAAQAGMTEAEFEAYQRSTQEARDAAGDALLYRTMVSVRAKRTKEYADARATVRAEVAEGVDQRPEFRALAAVKAGQRLDKQALLDRYGADALELMPKSVPPVYVEGGADADAVAETVGFADGDTMVRALMGIETRRKELRAANDKRSPRDVVIDEETDAIMADRYGDILADGTIEREARELIHNERAGEVMASELRALNRRRANKATPTPYALAKRWAARKVAEGEVREYTSRSALQRYQRAARKAGVEAEKAILAGDIDEAYRQKQAQMLNNALVDEGRKAAEQVEAAVGRLFKVARRRTMKSVDQDYLEQAHTLLEAVDLRQRSQVSIDRQGRFEEWAREQEAAGHDIVVPASFEASLGTTNYTRLTVENLLGLDDAVKQIIHLGRLKQSLIDGKEKRELEAIIAEAREATSKLPPRPPTDLMEPNWVDRFKDRVASIDASLLKVETVFDWLDSGKSDGVFNRIAFKPIAEAQSREKVMLREYTEELNAHMSAIPKDRLKRWLEKVAAPELINRETGNPFVFTRDQLVSIALNMGNEGNIQRLLDGYGWSEAGVMEALNRELGPEEWGYVQKVWDTIDKLWPEISAMERRINGIEPEKVEARPLETSAGPLRGGYYPAIYDPRRSVEAEANAARDSSSLFENIYTRATTRASSTKDRARKVSRPIWLSLGVIQRHVGEVIHDITHREAIMQADKFLHDRRVMKAVDETLGPQYRKMFRPWLQHVANEWAADRAGNGAMENFLKGMRSNATVVGMGFRVSTILMQLAGYSNSFERVGARWVVPAIAQFAAQSSGSAAKMVTFQGLEMPPMMRFVLERSGEVRDRMDNLDRDIRDTMRRTVGDKRPLTAAKRHAFLFIGMMDRAVVIPTWMGAYNKALAAGKNEDAAIYEADKAVRQSQGAGAAKDLAAVQRGTGKSGEALKLLTMFYSYMSAVWQRQRTLGRDTAEAIRERRISQVPELMARGWWLVVVPPLLSELLAGRGPEEEEDWGLWALQKMLFQALGPIPVIRDIAGPVTAAATDKPSFGYRFTPAAGGLETAVRSARDVGKIAEGEETTQATRNALEVVGYTTGLIPGQFAVATQFVVDVGYGEQEPETISDWYEGLTKGKVKED